MDGQNSIMSVVGPLATTVGSLRLVMRAILSQQPWLHDPLVHEMPWRSSHELEIRSLTESADSREGVKMCFGVMRTDGLVTPSPPIRRAIELVVEALRSHGHEVLDWNPPSHSAILDEAFKTWNFDAGSDVMEAFALSGEAMHPQVANFSKLQKHYSAAEIAGVNVRLRELRKEYLEYWNSTAKLSKTGRCVDAVIGPAAPWPAARPEKYAYYGYSTWVNALDYTSVVVPVTEVDKTLDVEDVDYEALDNRDQECHESCECDACGRMQDAKEPQMMPRSTTALTWACSWLEGDCKRRRCSPSPSTSASSSGDEWEGAAYCALCTVLVATSNHVHPNYSTRQGVGRCRAGELNST